MLTTTRTFWKKKKYERVVLLHHRDDGGGHGIGGHFEAVLLKAKTQDNLEFQGVFDYQNAFVRALLESGENNEVEEVVHEDEIGDEECEFEDQEEEQLTAETSQEEDLSED